ATALVGGAADDLEEERGGAPDPGVGAEGGVLRGGGVLPGGGVGEGGKGVGGLPALLPPPRDRGPRAVPPGDELLRSDETRRAGSSAHAEGDRSVQEAGKGVSAEPLRDRRPGEDRQVPRAACS